MSHERMLVKKCLTTSKYRARRKREKQSAHKREPVDCRFRLGLGKMGIQVGSLVSSYKILRKTARVNKKKYCGWIYLDQRVCGTNEGKLL